MSTCFMPAWVPSIPIALHSAAEPWSISSTAGWAAYVKKQAGKLLKQMGITSETIIYPEIQKLVLYRHTWGQLSETVESADTAVMMVIILPSQFKVSFLNRLTSADASEVTLLPFEIDSVK